MKTCRTCKQRWEPSKNDRHLDCPACKARKRRHPCSCGRMIVESAKKCSYCNNAGENNSNWKGGSVIHHAGYRMIRTSNHPRSGKSKYVFEHILIMEDYLGRYLLPGENVHHLNGVKTDNRIENLELWTKSQPAGQRVTDLIFWAKQILETYKDFPVKNLDE